MSDNGASRVCSARSRYPRRSCSLSSVIRSALPVLAPRRWSSRRRRRGALRRRRATPQLLREGWMHNRARLITASFLTKDLRQAERFDSDGAYVRCHVPELAGVPGSAVHTPWTLPGDQRRQLDYPGPIIDHSEAVRRFRQARGKDS
ncbi:MAG: FAD-binding domain-containing protein [Trebonia sp.]